jgi:anti-sigma factor RsiW
MNCQQFQDQLSEYLEGELPGAHRAECAAHRLCCPSCRALYQEVRGVVDALRGLAASKVEDHHRVNPSRTAVSQPPHPLNERILAATTMGEMVSCPGFDRLIEQYYDGVLLAPAHLALQDHFDRCPGCRQMMHGIESAILLCREARQHPVELPSGWVDRMVARTRALLPEPGPSRNVPSRNMEVADASPRLARGWLPMLSRDLVTALLMLAASSLLILVRFGSVEGLASHAETQAGLWVTQSQQSLAHLQRLSRQVTTRLQQDLSGPPPSPSASTGKE